MQLTSDIIERYNLQVDDQSELSSDEELALANEVYTDVCNDRPWEWLKTTYTNVTSTSLPYITLPTDFKEFSLNKDGKSVVFVGTDYAEYKVIPFSSRRDYRNMVGFCYVDSGKLYFTVQPTSVKAIEFDYIKRPTALTALTEPIVTTDQFGKMIAYGMAAKFTNIEQPDKTKGSYQSNNKAEFDKMLTDLQLEDASIKLAM
jgi:hypothetical protein